MSDAILLPKEKIDEISNTLHDLFTQAESDRSPYLTQLEDNRSLYKQFQVLEREPFVGACNLHVGLCEYMSQGLEARIARAVLNADPLYYVEGASPAAHEMAGEVEQYLKQQCLRQLRMRKIARPFIRSILRDGTAPVYTLWRTDTRRQLRYEVRQEVEIDLETGEAIGQVGSTRKVWEPTAIYDGPDLRQYPIEMVGCYPAAYADVQASVGCYIKQNLTGSQLLAGVQSGDYDKAAVESLRAVQEGVEHRQTPDDEERDIASTTTGATSDLTFHNRPFDLVEWYYQYPMKENEPAVDWLVTMERHQRVIIRAIPNPWGHGFRPVTPLRALPPRFGMLGLSVPDMVGNDQRFMSIIMRQLIDAGSWLSNPSGFVSNAMSDKELAQYLATRKPGSWHRTSTENINQAIQQLQTGFDINAALIVIQEMLRWAERKTGFNDTRAGLSKPGSTTAYEIEQMLSEGQENLTDMIETVSEGFTEIGEILLKLDYEYSGNPSQQALWQRANPTAEFDLTTALSEQYDVYAAGSSQTTNRGLRAKRAAEKFEALREDPFVNTDPTGKRQYALRADLLTDGFSDRSPERLIGREEEAELIPMVQQAAQMVQVAMEMAQVAEGGAPGPAEGPQEMM